MCVWLDQMEVCVCVSGWTRRKSVCVCVCVCLCVYTFHHVGLTWAWRGPQGRVPEHKGLVLRQGEGSLLSARDPMQGLRFVDEAP